jgi:hypothetical protein
MRAIKVVITCLLVVITIGIAMCMVAPVPDVIKKFDLTIPNYTKERHLKSTAPDQIINKFTEGVNFGGAGGIVNMEFYYSNSTAFLDFIADNPNIDTIAVTQINNFRASNNNLYIVRNYWALNSTNFNGAAIINQQAIPRRISWNYRVKDITTEAVIFTKDWTGYIVMLIILAIIWAIWLVYHEEISELIWPIYPKSARASCT